MVIQLTDQEGRQIRQLTNVDADIELNGGKREFRIIIPINEFDSRIRYGCRIFVAGTEIGGIIGRIQTDTAANEVAVYGYSWRGLLEKKILMPPENADHLTVSGELNKILRDLIEPVFSGIFVVPQIDTGVTISSYEFDRFCTLRAGLKKMLEMVSYRLEIVYNQGLPNEMGQVEVSAVPIVDYSAEIELSGDCRLNYCVDEVRNGVNHLIIGGKGELQDRQIIHLYVQEDGTIGKNRYYTGIEEIEAFYENTSTDSSDVEEKGKEELKELMNGVTFDIDVEQLSLDVAIGDIIGGRDHITGIYAKRPVENIVITMENGKTEKNYTLEE